MPRDRKDRKLRTFLLKSGGIHLPRRRGGSSVSRERTHAPTAERRRGESHRGFTLGKCAYFTRMLFAIRDGRLDSPTRTACCEDSAQSLRSGRARTNAPAPHLMAFTGPSQFPRPEEPPGSRPAAGWRESVPSRWIPPPSDSTFVKSDGSSGKSHAT